MTEADGGIILERAKDLHPEVRPFSLHGRSRRDAMVPIYHRCTVQLVWSATPTTLITALDLIKGEQMV